MKNFFINRKDGGEESHVRGYFLVELRSLFSIAVLHFADGSRDAYHSHAFNCISWVLKGRLEENMIDGVVRAYRPGLQPIITKRTDFHKVVSTGDTWVLTFRGPWVNTWREYLPKADKFLVLAQGRKVVG